MGPPGSLKPGQGTINADIMSESPPPPPPPPPSRFSFRRTGEAASPVVAGVSPSGEVKWRLPDSAGAGRGGHSGGAGGRRSRTPPSQRTVTFVATANDDDEDDETTPLVPGRKSSDGEDERDVTKSRSGGCCGMQRSLGRFFYRNGLAAAWFSFRVFMALIGTTVFWLGAWNLGQYDCVFTPFEQACLQNTTHGGAASDDALDMLDVLPRPSAAYGGRGRFGGGGWAGGGDGLEEPLLGKGRPKWLGQDMTALRGEITMAVGFLLMIVSDTLYCNANLDGALLPRLHQVEFKGTWGGRLVMFVRIVFGLTGGTLFWGGIYSMLLYEPPLSRWSYCDRMGTCLDDMVVHAVVFGVGLVLVAATGTWSGTCFLYYEEDSGRPNALQRLLQMHDAEDKWNMSGRDHARYVVRSVACILGQTLLWISSGRALDYTTPEEGDTVFRPLFFVWLGMALMSLTDSVAANAWIEREVYESVAPAVVSLADVRHGDGSEEYYDDSEPASSASVAGSGALFDGSSMDGEVDSEDNVSEAPSEPDGGGCGCGGFMTPAAIKFYLTSFVSLLGQLIFVYGLWVLLDVFWVGTANLDGIATPGRVLTYRSTELNLILIVVGLATLAVGGAVMTNACISVVPVHSTTPPMEQIQKEITHLQEAVAEDDRVAAIGQIRKLKSMTSTPLAGAIRPASMGAGGSSSLRHRRHSMSLGTNSATHSVATTGSVGSSSPGLPRRAGSSPVRVRTKTASSVSSAPGELDAGAGSAPGAHGSSLRQVFPARMETHKE